MTLLSFHNDPKIKQKYLDRVIAHKKADELIKGTYWENGKGCAVGCTIHSSDHSKYKTELGIPEWLARLEDIIFEGLPNDKSKDWPIRFLSAIEPGKDLDQIKTSFIIIALESCLKSLEKNVFDMDKYPDVASSIEQSKLVVVEMIRCHKEGVDLSAAEFAAWSAESAAHEHFSDELIRLIKEVE